ncbi:MAG: hypothetical protein ABSH49_36570 [Bryobacteraceae bacterium]|jgi:hypothetical protein
MILLLWRLTRGYRLRPWKSPYLRWRLETYWGVHADQVTFREFWSLTWRERRALLRYLRWAAEMDRESHRVPRVS